MPQIKTDKELADLVLDKIQEYAEKYSTYRHYISNYGMKIIVDLSAASFMQVFVERIYHRARIDSSQMD